LKFDILKKGIINKGILLIRGEKRRSIFLKKEGRKGKKKLKEQAK
jgi:hypothetical protein